MPGVCDRFSMMAEAHVVLALNRLPPCWGPGGPFTRLGYMDNTTWCVDSESDLPVFVDNLQNAGLQTNLFSFGPKHLLVVAAYESFQVTFRPRSVTWEGRSCLCTRGWAMCKW